VDTISRWKNGLAADADNKSVDAFQVLENPNPVGQGTAV